MRLSLAKMAGGSSWVDFGGGHELNQPVLFVDVDNPGRVRAQVFGAGDILLHDIAADVDDVGDYTLGDETGRILDDRDRYAIG